MRRWHSYFFHILVFIFAQLAWLSLLSLWIYWYVSNYIIFSTVDDKLSTKMVAEGTNVFALVSGLILMVAISVGMSLLFRRLSIQYNLTGLYDNFIANVTHELKSPLASVQLYLETLKKHNISRAKQKEFIEIMIKDTERLNNLINSILEIPGLEHKKIAHNFSVYNAESIVRTLVQEAVDQFQIKPNSIEIEGRASCRCVVDQNALRIVIFNLIDNGIKYKADVFNMKVDISCEHKYFVMTFKDKGIGISVKEQKNVFKKFYRIYNHGIPNVKGTGLGLYWTKEIIKYHGGKIAVISDGQYKGTTFRIELPIYKASKKRYIEKLIKLTQKQKRQKGKDEK